MLIPSPASFEVGLNMCFDYEFSENRSFSLMSGQDEGMIKAKFSLFGQNFVKFYC